MKALLFVACWLALAQAPLVEVARVRGEERWTVRASEAPVAELTQLVAARAGRRLAGAELSSAASASISPDGR
jgi:hypothetical protein